MHAIAAALPAVRDPLSRPIWELDESALALVVGLQPQLDAEQAAASAALQTPLLTLIMQALQGVRVVGSGGFRGP